MASELIPLPAPSDLAAADDLLATLKALPDSAPIVGIDASNVERLYTPIARILCSAIKSDLPISIVSPSEEFIEACNDLGIWAQIEKRVEE